MPDEFPPQIRLWLLESVVGFAAIYRNEGLAVAARRIDGGES